MDSPYYAEVVTFSLALAAAFGWGLATLRRLYRTRRPVIRDNDGRCHAVRQTPLKGPRP
jgi:hypothetical protein